MTMTTNRRRLLTGLAVGATVLSAPSILRAQAGPIRLGTLTPLTGAGGPFGPAMANVARAVAEQVNAAGGILGRQIQVISEDDQTNPEAGVRAARKLIDVDRVQAIMGTWASSVTTAVAPLCWENRVFLTTVSGADSITQLPHNGWLVRTQPISSLQGRKFAEFCLEVSAGGRRCFFMMPQTPFTQSTFAAFKSVYDRVGGATELLIYDDKKPSLRTEVDQALRFRPDCIFVGGYLPDTTVLLRELFRADYRGRIVGPGYSIGQQVADALPHEVTEGAYGINSSPAVGSTGFERVRAILNAEPTTFACQVYDHINLVLMAMAAGGDGTGQAARDNVRRVSQGGGERIDNALDGLRAIAAGRKIDYDGASGPCDFTDAGDITDAKMRYEQVRGGRVNLVRIA